MDDLLGCKHYKRGCAFIAPCCKKEYTCRICHDDKETHVLNRKTVKMLKCLSCGTSQGLSNQCYSCSRRFGKYFCDKCNLYDNDTTKEQFHCDACSICRVGGRENFFHCLKCDLCLSVKMKDKHKCVEKVSRSDCSICLEDLHTSREPTHVSPCGHLLHKKCFQDMLKTGNYCCPLCNESMLEMESCWKELDKQVSSTEMPEEYRNYYVQVLCRDCHKESRTLFHVIGLKCQNCGSYNTTRCAEPNSQVEATTEGASSDTVQQLDNSNC